MDARDPRGFPIQDVGVIPWARGGFRLVELGFLLWGFGGLDLADPRAVEQACEVATAEILDAVHA